MDDHRPIAATSLSIVPANQVRWNDLHAVFGQRDSGRCNCQRFKTRGWFWEQATDEQRRARLRDQANCDDPTATSTTGLAEVSRPSVRRAVMRIDFTENA